MNRLNITTLSTGSHTPQSGKGCLLEAVSQDAGEAWSDHPACVCPVLSEYGRVLNDAMPDNATRDKYLLPIVPLLLNTADPAKQQARMYHFADAAIRRFAPLALRAAGLETEAQCLEACEPITDKRTAEAAAGAARAAESESAWAAAWAARSPGWTAWAAAEAGWAAVRAVRAAGDWELAAQVYREAITL